MKPGSYKARVCDWGINESRSGRVQTFVKFETLDGPNDQNRSVYWYGSLDETPRVSERTGKPYTMLGITKGTLKTLGYKGADILSFVEQDALSMEETFEITVEDFQPNSLDKIPMVRRIKSLSRPEDNQTSEGPRKLSKAEATAKLANLMKAESMKKVVNSSTVDEDIPF